MRVVLDTNVLVFALLFKGRLFRVFEAIDNSELTLCFTVATFGEFESVICRSKFGQAFRRHDISPQAVTKFVRGHALIVPTPSRIPAPIAEDAADNHILAAVALLQANCIVSGDAHLTRLGLFDDIPILTPRQFLSVL